MIIVITDSIRYKSTISLCKELLKNDTVMILMYSDTYTSLKIKNELYFHKNLLYKTIARHFKLVSLFRKYFFKKNSLFFKLMMKSKYTTLGQLFYEYLFRIKFWISYKTAEKTFKEYKVTSLVIIIDRSIDFIGFLKKAHKNRIPIIQPYYYNPIASYSICINNKKYQLNSNTSYYQKWIFNKFKKSIYGKQVNNGYFFFPAFIIKSLYEFGTLPKNLWVGGSGLANYVFVDTGIMHNNLINKSIDYKKIKILGNKEIDILYNSYKNKYSIKENLTNKYFIKKDSNICIFSAAPVGEHSIVTIKQGYQDFEEVLKTIANTLNYKILISLHPKMQINYKKYKEIASKYDAIILEEKLYESLVIADLYITTSSSSTLIWGILNEIKTISIDFWNMKNNLFEDSCTIKFVNTKKDLTNALKYCDTKKLSFHQDWQIINRNSIFDGKSLKKQAEFISTCHL
jgi:hypothetical protein